MNVKIKDNKTGNILTVTREQLKDMNDVTLLDEKRNVNKMELQTRRLDDED